MNGSRFHIAFIAVIYGALLAPTLLYSTGFVGMEFDRVCKNHDRDRVGASDPAVFAPVNNAVLAPPASDNERTHPPAEYPCSPNSVFPVSEVHAPTLPPSSSPVVSHVPDGYHPPHTGVDEDPPRARG